MYVPILFLTSPYTYPRIILPHPRPAARHDAADRGAKGGPPTTRPVILPQAARARLRGGAPGGAAARWQGLANLQITPARSLGTGLANPSEWGLAKPVLARRVGVVEEMPSTMRGLANPWRLPALHSPSGKGKRDRRCPRRAKEQGGGALAK